MNVRRETDPQSPTSPILARWLAYDDEYCEHDITLETAGGRHGIGIWKEEGEIVVATGNLWVDEKMRQTGVGTRLLKAGLVLAKNHGATISSSDVYSPHALKIRQNIFGENNLRFWDASNFNIGELPISVSQAIMSLERAAQSAEEYRTSEEGFIVRSVLADVDMCDWEQPIEVNAPDLPTD